MILIKKGIKKGLSFSVGVGLSVGVVIKMDDIMYS
jgi:hypothetical protein